jgi:hypothetical protein
VSAEETREHYFIFGLFSDSVDSAKVQLGHFDLSIGGKQYKSQTLTFAETHPPQFTNKCKGSTIDREGKLHFAEATEMNPVTSVHLSWLLTDDLCESA